MTDVKYIQLLVADFQKEQLPQTENAKKAVYLDDLERHEFGLLQKQIAHDLAAVSAYRSDSQNVDNLIYHRKLRSPAAELARPTGPPRQVDGGCWAL